MTKLERKKVKKIDASGNKWLTRDPKTVDSILRREFKKLQDQTLVEISSSLPEVSEINRARLLEGANLEKPTIEDFIRRFSLTNLLQFISSLSLGAISYQIATYGDDPSSIYHGLYNFLNNNTPVKVSQIMNAFNNSPPFIQLLWGIYDKVPILGPAGIISVAGVAKSTWFSISEGLIQPQKRYKLELEQMISGGVYPYRDAGHTVIYGGEDPIMSAKIEVEKKTFARALRERGEIVLIQKTGPQWQAGSSEAKLNENNIYTNLAQLDFDKTPSRQDVSPTIVSGAYKSNLILMNMQQGRGLFEQWVVDDSSNKGLDFSLGERVLRYSKLLRQAVYEIAPRQFVVVIIPQFCLLKKSLNGRGQDPWMYTIEAFLKSVPDVDGVIVPEGVFLDRVLKELMERDKLNGPIYMDFEGTTDSLGRAERCRNCLLELYRKNGITPPEIYTRAKHAQQAKVSIMVRDTSTHLELLTIANELHFGQELVLYSATTHTRPGYSNRIPIRYKDGIAIKIIEILRGIENEYSSYKFLNALKGAR
ncbi:MAG: hypothetical protein AABX33_07515 [Nanoarchaeota archaeon]